MTETLFSIEDSDVHAPDIEAGPEHSSAVAAVSVAKPQELEERAPIVAPAPVFSFLGENRQGYLFVTHDPHSDYMSAEGMDAFTKTLAARKLALTDVAVFNLARHAGEVAVADLVSFFKPRAVILLGLEATRLGMPALVFNAIGTAGDVTVFQTYSFDEMIEDAAKKNAFWPVLKSLL